MSIIVPAMFSGLLSNMASQYIENNCAYCATAKDFDNQLPKEAVDFFSIVVMQCDELDDCDVLAVLTDDTKNDYAELTFTFTIFINYSRFHGVMPKINLAVIFAHEICHFAFIYEFFMSIKGKQGAEKYQNFKNAFSKTLDGVLIQDKSDKHILPEGLTELIEEFSNFPKEHFTQDRLSEINFKTFFFHFLERLNLSFSKDDK
jgi:hypothetical protein